jgi:hypothetical protein
MRLLTAQGRNSDRSSHEREMTTVLAHGHMSQELGSGGLARKKGLSEIGNPRG